MSSEKEKLEDLLKRVDEILLHLKGISEDLKTVSASLKSMAVSQITHPITSPQAAVSHEGQKSLEDIRMSFPADLEDLLNFEDKTDYFVIKPRQFLGSENFAKIASTVRNLGGEYISAGKDSHFRVYKKRV
jgi:hypothetical protein